MSDIRNRFIDAATTAYGDDMERKLAAKAWMTEGTASVPEEDLLPAIKRWETVDAKKRWKHRETTLLIIWAVISLMMIFPFYLLLKETDELVEPFGRRILKLGKNIDEWGPGYAPEDAKPYLFQQTGLPRQERARRLWSSDPANPAYFGEYAAIARWMVGLPPDFRTVAGKLDPDNAWFHQFEAGSLAIRAVKKNVGKYDRWEGELSDSWEILDQARFDEALDLLRQAAKKPNTVTMPRICSGNASGLCHLLRTPAAAWPICISWSPMQHERSSWGRSCPHTHGGRQSQVTRKASGS